MSGEVTVLTPTQAEQAAVPFAPGFDLEALKKVDEEPFFATLSIKPGPGGQGAGPNYGPALLQDIMNQINTKRPPGYKGHQDPERISWEYREPVTAWVGAQWNEAEQELLVKGYVPATAPDLRTQLRLAESGADVVNSVSIFGMRDVEGDQVTRFDLWSLDWTPKGRNGMQTELVGVSGEQAKEEEVDRDQVIASLKAEEVPAHLVERFKSEALEGVSDKAALADEIMALLGLGEDSDSQALIDKVKDLVVSAEVAELDEKLDEVLTDKVEAEMARAAVKDAILPKLSVNSTEDEIAGEIASALEKPYIKALASGDPFPVVSGGAGNQDDTRQGTSWE